MITPAGEDSAAVCSTCPGDSTNSFGGASDIEGYNGKLIYVNPEVTNKIIFLQTAPNYH